MTDSEEEYQALRKMISDTVLDMIQWRNFNIDPGLVSWKNSLH